LLWKLPFLLHY